MRLPSEILFINKFNNFFTREQRWMDLMFMFLILGMLRWRRGVNAQSTPVTALMMAQPPYRPKSEGHEGLLDIEH